MRKFALLSLLLIGLVLSACDDISGLSGRSVDGNWRTQVDGEEVRVRLYEDAGRITGSGSWGFDRVRVYGDRVGSDIYLEFEFSGFNPIEFEGRVLGSELDGWLHGSGFRGDPATFWRD